MDNLPPQESLNVSRIITIAKWILFLDMSANNVNLTFWYERKQGESRFLGNNLPLDNFIFLIICSLRV